MLTLGQFDVRILTLVPHAFVALYEGLQQTLVAEFFLPAVAAGIVAEARRAAAEGGRRGVAWRGVVGFFRLVSLLFGVDIMFGTAAAPFPPVTFMLLFSPP